MNETVRSLGKCDVKGCNNEATAASIALTRDGLAKRIMQRNMARRKPGREGNEHETAR